MHHIFVLGIVYRLWRNTLQLLLTQLRSSGKSLYPVCSESCRARLREAYCPLILICKCTLWGGLRQGLFSLRPYWSMISTDCRRLVRGEQFSGGCFFKNLPSLLANPTLCDCTCSTLLCILLAANPWRFLN